MKLSAAEKLDGQDGDWMSAWMQTNATTKQSHKKKRNQGDTKRTKEREGEPLKFPGAASNGVKYVEGRRDER